MYGYVRSSFHPVSISLNCCVSCAVSLRKGSINVTISCMIHIIMPREYTCVVLNSLHNSAYVIDIYIFVRFSSSGIVRLGSYHDPSSHPAVTPVSFLSASIELIEKMVRQKFASSSYSFMRLSESQQWQWWWLWWRLWWWVWWELGGIRRPDG